MAGNAILIDVIHNGKSIVRILFENIKNARYFITKLDTNRRMRHDVHGF